ncbi:MAG TPA: DUF3021 family protein [Terriglobales bacterium]|nr:DUF3021 family protein [Terriglobales bacterium]
MRGEEILKKMLVHFFIITTGTVTAVYLFCRLFYPTATFQTADLGRILWMAAAGDLPLAVFYSRRELTRGEMRLREVLHFLLLVGVILSLAWRWGWVNLGRGIEVGGLLLSIVLIYLAVSFVTDCRDRKVTEQLNDKLRERYGPQQ